MSSSHLILMSSDSTKLKLESEFNPHSHKKEDNQLSVEIQKSWTQPARQIILYPDQIKELSRFLNENLTGPSQSLHKTGGYSY